MSPVMKNPKKRGEWVEMQFMARAAHLGFTVCRPWGDSTRYDFVLDYKGKFYRVQVKSTNCFTGGAYLCNTVSRGPRGYTKKPHYTAKQIDFFAFYIIPEDLWYIVPIADARRARFAVYLNPHYRKNRWFPNLEAWHLLKSRA